MSKKYLVQLSQSGDTIVEVLIALTILTFVLVGAYYTANKSYQSVRDSQEHSEAINIAQTQAEELRILGNPSANWNTSTPDLCAYNSGGVISASALASKCSQNIDSTNSVFTIKDSLTSKSYIAGVTFYTYQINVSWQALGGGKDQVTLYYRVDS